MSKTRLTLLAVFVFVVIGCENKEIFIDNGNGYDSRHLHMNRIVVQPGQRIEPGQLLGYTGGAVGTKGAGHSTGPHLHTEIRLNGQLLDPLSKDSNGTLLDQFFGYGVN